MANEKTTFTGTNFRSIVKDLKNNYFIVLTTDKYNDENNTIGKYVTRIYFCDNTGKSSDIALYGCVYFAAIDAARGHMMLCDNISNGSFDPFEE